jgi:hypothetical protein
MIMMHRIALNQMGKIFICTHVLLFTYIMLNFQLILLTTKGTKFITKELKVQDRDSFVILCAFLCIPLWLTILIIQG